MGTDILTVFQISTDTRKKIMGNFPYFSTWMDDLWFYVLFKSISVMSGRWIYDNERLCSLEPFTVEKISPRAGLALGTARSVG